MYPNYYKSSQKVSVKAVSIRSYKAGIDIQKMLQKAKDAVDFEAIGDGLVGAYEEIKGWISKHGEALGRTTYGDLKGKLAELNKATEEYNKALSKYFGKFGDTITQAARSELAAKGFVVAGLIAFILSMIITVYRELSKLGPNITKAIKNGEYFIDNIGDLSNMYESDPNNRGIQEEVIMFTEAANVYARVEIRKLLKPMKDVFPDDYNRIMDIADQIDEVTLGFREDTPEQAKPALKKTIELIRRLVDELAAFQDKTSELERDDLSKKVEKRLR